MLFSSKQAYDCSKIAISLMVKFAFFKETVELFEGFVKECQESSAISVKCPFLAVLNDQKFEYGLPL
jgi:hypothetical protein